MTENSKFPTCPPKMSDGRHFTDYAPRCIARDNLMLGVDNKQMNSYELRQYLIANSEKIMQSNRDAAIKCNSWNACVQPYNQGTMLAEQNMVKCDTTSCRTSINDPYGIGTGRDYGTNSVSVVQASCTDCINNGVVSGQEYMPFRSIV